MYSIWLSNITYCIYLYAVSSPEADILMVLMKIVKKGRDSQLAIRLSEKNCKCRDS